MLSKTFLATVIVSVTSVAFAAEPLDEKGFQKLMKEVGASAKKLKSGLDAKSSAEVVREADRVAEIYKEHLAFWKDRKSEKAVKWSEESAASASALAASAKKGDWE